MPEPTEQASKPRHKWPTVIMAAVAIIWLVAGGVVRGPYPSLPVGPIVISPLDVGVVLTFGMIGIFLGIALVMGRDLPLGGGKSLTGARARTAGVVCLICSGLLFLAGFIGMVLMLILREMER